MTLTIGCFCRGQSSHSIPPWLECASMAEGLPHHWAVRPRTRQRCPNIGPASEDTGPILRQRWPVLSPVLRDPHRADIPWRVRGVFLPGSPQIYRRFRAARRSLPCFGWLPMTARPSVPARTPGRVKHDSKLILRDQPFPRRDVIPQDNELGGLS